MYLKTQPMWVLLTAITCYYFFVVMLGTGSIFYNFIRMYKQYSQCILFLKMICPLSSRQVKYLKQSADERPYEMCGRFSMHTIFLYISQFVCSEDLYILLDVPQKVPPFVPLAVFYNGIYPEVVLRCKI